MKIDARVALILWHPDGKRVLLLHRAPTKKLLPNLITGIGGKVELEKGEGENIEQALWREFVEETHIPRDLISDTQLMLTASDFREDTLYVLYWFVGRLKDEPTDLACSEGVLGWYDVSNLPLQDFTPTARESIPFALKATPGHVGHYIRSEDGTLKLSV